MTAQRLQANGYTGDPCWPVQNHACRVCSLRDYTDTAAVWAASSTQKNLVITAVKMLYKRLTTAVFKFFKGFSSFTHKFRFRACLRDLHIFSTVHGFIRTIPYLEST